MATRNASDRSWISVDDGLPMLVCSSCRDQLDACHRFRRVAHRTQKSLQSYLAYTATLCGSEQLIIISVPTTTTTTTASDYRLNSIGGSGNCLRVSSVFRRPM
uniref:ZAD domain-containing protein n=1 Tax=Anopheles albimanus TaxID=7167 RepID=A0A182F515_ANOAL